MSDSSSEDEVSEQLRESVDKNFMNDKLYSENSNATREICPFTPSLRKKKDEIDHFKRTGLTKSNQKFIADKLFKLLDKKLEKSFSHNSTVRMETKCGGSGGVLLFSDSNDFLCHVDETYLTVKKNRNHRYEIIEEELEKRCQEVAVTAKWITSGIATKGWCKNGKGEVIRVKKIKQLNCGVLECELIKTCDDR